MKHDWKPYADPGKTLAQSFISEPARRCANCGAIQQHETEYVWMRVFARRWRPLVGRCHRSN